MIMEAYVVSQVSLTNLTMGKSNRTFLLTFMDRVDPDNKLASHKPPEVEA